MSNILKQRTKSIISYEGGAFIEGKFASGIAELIKENCPNSYVWDYDIGTFTDTWELNTEDLEKYKNELKKEPLKNQILISDPFIPEPITVEYMIKLIEKLLKVQYQNQFNLQYPELIILDWM